MVGLYCSISCRHYLVSFLEGSIGWGWNEVRDLGVECLECQNELFDDTLLRTLHVHAKIC